MVYAHLAAAHGTSPAKRTWSRSGANGEELHLSARVANWEINSIANHSKGLGEAWWLSCGKSECQSVLQVGCLDEFSHAGAPLEMRPTLTQTVHKIPVKHLDTQWSCLNLWEAMRKCTNTKSVPVGKFML